LHSENPKHGKAFLHGNILKEKNTGASPDNNKNTAQRKNRHYFFHNYKNSIKAFIDYVLIIQYLHLHICIIIIVTLHQKGTGKDCPCKCKNENQN
jgi:hypothetical protein